MKTNKLVLAVLMAGLPAGDGETPAPRPCAMARARADGAGQRR